MFFFLLTPLLIFIQISVDTVHGYTPRAIDMSNVTLSRELHVSYMVIVIYIRNVMF